MKIDRELLREQITTLSFMLDRELMIGERDTIEGVLNLLESISDNETDLLTIELV